MQRVDDVLTFSGIKTAETIVEKKIHFTPHIQNTKSLAAIKGCTFFPSAGTTTTTYTYKITTTSGVNLRSGAGTSYGKLTTIPYNKTVTVTEVKNGWGKTTYGGKTGWFSLDYAKKTGTTTTTTGGSSGSGDTSTATSVKYVITASNGVNMRSGAGTSYGKVGAIPYNKTVTVTEVKNGWGKTTYGGKTGWFSLDYAKKA